MEEPIKEQPSAGVSGTISLSLTKTHTQLNLCVSMHSVITGWFLVGSGNSGSARPKLQRYALRSFIKSKEHKPDVSDRSNSSESNTKRYFLSLFFFCFLGGGVWGPILELWISSLQSETKCVDMDEPVVR